MLHDDRHDAAGVFDAEDGRDIWMMQSGQQPRFAFEPRAAFRVLREGGGKHLHRDIPSKPRVARPVDVAHRATADRSDDGKLADLRAHQGH
jgi:hypothetical protein